MMYDQNGNAQVAAQVRGTRDYTPAQLGINGAVLPGSGQVASNWVEVRGYSRITAFATADQTFQLALQLAADSLGTGATTVMSTGNTLTAGSWQAVCNHGDPAAGMVGSDQAARGAVWAYARVVVINATANAGTATAHLHLVA